MMCPVCEGAGASVATRGSNTVRQCSTCQMVFAEGPDARSHSEAVVDTDPHFYNAVAQKFPEQTAAAAEIVPRRLQAYKDLLGRPVERVIEVGCGTGAYARAFLDAGIAYTAFEINDDIAEMARTNSGATINAANFIEATIDEPADVVFASQVFEHVTTPAPFLAKVQRATTPNGILHVDVPNHAGLVSQVRKRLSKTDYGFIQPPHHMLAYTPKTLDHVLRENGLRPIQVRQYRNDDPVWGQLIGQASLPARLVYVLTDLVGRGSLLTALAITSS